MTSRTRMAGANPSSRVVPADVAAANAAYIASLDLPPLTQAQANHIRAVVEASTVRMATDAAVDAAA